MQGLPVAGLLFVAWWRRQKWACRQVTVAKRHFLSVNRDRFGRHRPLQGRLSPCGLSLLPKAANLSTTVASIIATTALAAITVTAIMVPIPDLPGITVPGQISPRARLVS